MLYSLIDSLQKLALGRAFFLAYSGGLDSRFLAHIAERAGISFVLLHVRGPHVTSFETDYAIEWARKRLFSLELLDFDPLVLPDVQKNNKERCYACKRAIFEIMLTHIGAKGLSDFLLCDGSNHSDLGKFRPGLRALKELGIVSPLALASFEKQHIYSYAKESGLEDPSQKARPCLLTRFPYGVEPSVELLKQIEEGEAFILHYFKEKLSELPDFRLRFLPSGNATNFSLHVDRELSLSLQKDLIQGLAQKGIVLHIEYLRELSGFFDEKPSL